MRPASQMLRFALTLAASLSLPLTLSATAQAEGYFAGKDMEIIVPVNPGGGADAVARLFAEYLSTHLAGNPSVHVSNIAGGGGILAANTFANQRKHDGTNLMYVTQINLLPAILGDAAVEYDLGKFRALWTADRGQSTMVFGKDAGVSKPEDLAAGDKQFFLGTINPAGTDLPVLVGFKALGLLENDKVKVVAGYESGSALENAFAAGELTILRDGSTHYLKNFKDIYPALFTLGQIGPDGALIRDKVVPDLPHIGEVYTTLHGKGPSGTEWEAFLMLQDLLGRGGVSLQTHAAAPAEAIAELDAAIASAMQDAEFIRKTSGFLGPEPGSLIGAQAEAWGKGVANVDPKLIEWLRGFLHDKFDLDFK